MKTAEEIAKELYPEWSGAMKVGNYEQREAFVKGYQRRCLEEQTEMGEYAKQEKESKLREAAEKVIAKWNDKCAITMNDIKNLEQALNENN